MNNAGTVAAGLLHAPPPLAARGFTRQRDKRWKMGGSGSASSPLHFPAGGDLQSTQKTQQAVDFNFFLSCSRIYFFSSPFWVCFCLYRSAFLWVSPSSLFQAAGWLDVFQSTAVQLLVSGSAEMEENEVV
jgi:hypothetical protein